VLERLHTLQNKNKEGKNLVKFNLTEEVIDTIGIFILKATFGDVNVSQDESVRIYIDGVEQIVSFPVAYRTVLRQTFEAKHSFYRYFLIDPLSDWCLTPEERRVRHN
jgi:hypothetical protein